MADEPTPIQAAIDRAEARRLDEELAKLEPRHARRLNLLDAPHAWSGEEEIVLQAPTEDRGRRPVLIVYDEVELAWRAILLPPGSSWRVVPDRSGLWTPAQ